MRALRADTDRYLTYTAVDSHPISTWDRRLQPAQFGPSSIKSCHVTISPET